MMIFALSMNEIEPIEVLIHICESTADAHVANWQH